MTQDTTLDILLALMMNNDVNVTNRDKGCSSKIESDSVVVPDFELLE